MTPTKTPFAGYERLEAGDPLSSDGYAFQSLNPVIADLLGKLGAVTHRHDGHAAMADPATAPVVVISPTGGAIPANTPIFVTYTLNNADGGETLPVAHIAVTTPIGFVDPSVPPASVVDYTAGTLLAGDYSYAATVTDGVGGETALSPSAEISVEPGFANSEVHLSGLAALVTSSSGGAGGAGWRLWRSQGGGPWYLIGTGSSDTFLDNGVAGDCTISPPDQGTTVGANSLSVTVPATAQPVEAVLFNIYASLDGSFTSPSLLGTYPVADFGSTKTYTDLSVIDGAPPAVSTCYPGANQINPDTDIIAWPWKRSVANLAALPTVGNVDGDVRETLDTHTLYTWKASTSSWIAVGGGGGGGGAGFVNLTDHGVVIDGVLRTDGHVVAGTPDLTTTGTPFVPSDVGKLVAVQAGLSTARDHNTLITTIASYVSSSHVVLADNADQTFSGLTFLYGTDNHTAFNAYMGTPRAAYVFAGPGFCLSSGALNVFGNHLYGVRDRSVFVNLNPATSIDDVFHIGGGYSSSIIDVVPASGFNFGGWIGSPPTVPSGGWAVKTVGGGSPVVPPVLRIDITSYGFADGLPMPPWSGVNADAVWAHVEIDGNIYTQGGPCADLNTGTGTDRFVTMRASYNNNNALAAATPYDVIVRNAYNALLDGVRCDGGSLGRGLLIVGPFIQRLRTRDCEFNGLDFAPAASFNSNNLHFHETDFGNTGATSARGAIIDPAGNTLTGVRLTDCVVGGDGLIVNGGTRVRVNGTDVRNTGSGTNRGKIIVAAGVSHFRLTDNDVTLGITVAAGGSDYYAITGNDCTGVAVSDGGTGTHKTVTGNF